MTLDKINEAANMWNETKDPQYKEVWYKLVKEFANVQNINNTDTIGRRDPGKRRISIGKTNGST
jgi:hypothetical protein